MHFDSPFRTRPSELVSDWFNRSTTTTATDSMLPALALFGAGLLVGASVALLVAPKSGDELRGDVARTAGKVTDTVRAKLPGPVKRKADELINDLAEA